MSSWSACKVCAWNWESMTTWRMKGMMKWPGYSLRENGSKILSLYTQPLMTNLLMMMIMAANEHSSPIIRILLFFVLLKVAAAAAVVSHMRQTQLLRRSSASVTTRHSWGSILQARLSSWAKEHRVSTCVISSQKKHWGGKVLLKYMITARYKCLIWWAPWNWNHEHGCKQATQCKSLMPNQFQRRG